MTKTETGLQANDRAFLLHAIAISSDTMQSGKGGPFGALIVRNGKVIAEGGNEVLLTNDPTAHAEIIAIRRACQKVGEFSLAGATLYSSCEPCPMCLSTIYWAQIDRIVFANTRDAAEKIGFIDRLLYDEVAKTPQQRKLTCTHLPLKEAQAVFKAWKSKTDRVNY